MEAFCKSCDSIQEVECVADTEAANLVYCLACGEEFLKEEAKGDKYDHFHIARVLKVEPISKQKDLKKILADIRGDGDESLAIQIVTNAKYIDESWLVVVALENAVVPAGAIVGEDSDATLIKPTSVGGVKSNGMVCDSPMLAWSGGAKGAVQQLPERDENGTIQFVVGDKPPTSRPRV